MYFTDTPELRKFEREMRQKPNCRFSHKLKKLFALNEKN